MDDITFEIADKGWGWPFKLDEQTTCWFGRGPSGLLLGPFANQSNCALAIDEDDRLCWQEIRARAVATTPVKPDRVIGINPTGVMSEDATLQVIELGFRSGTRACIVITSDGVVEDVWDADPQVALQKAMYLRPANERSGP